MELSVTHIDGDDFTRAVAQQAIRESPGRGSHIQQHLVRYPDGEMLEGGLQLEPPTTDLG